MDKVCSAMEQAFPLILFSRTLCSYSPVNKCCIVYSDTSQCFGPPNPGDAKTPRDM